MLRGFSGMLVCRSSQAANAARSIADTVQCFITAMDSLKLGMSAVDEVDTLFASLNADALKMRPGKIP